MLERFLIEDAYDGIIERPVMKPAVVGIRQRIFHHDRVISGVDTDEVEIE